MRQITALTALTILLSAFLNLAAPQPVAGIDEMKGKIRVLVLPFATPHNVPELERYGSGTMDTLIMALKHVPTFIMIDRAQIEEQIKKQALQVTTVANDKTAGVKLGGLLGAQVLMAGSMQRAGNLVRITANVIDIESSVINQSEKVTGEIKKLFDLQLQLAQFFARDVKIEITPEQQQSIETVVKSTTQIEAYDLYLKGRTAYLLFTTAGYEEAVKWFQKALESDPNYALAYAGLGQAYASWGIQVEKQGQDPKPYYDKALANATKARELAPNIAEPYLALAVTYNALSDRDNLQNNLDRLLTTDPNSAEGYMMLATLFKKNDPKVIAHLEHALKLNPNLTAAHTSIARAYDIQGQPEKAIAHFKKALELNPKDPIAYTNLGEVYYKQGQAEQAMHAWETALQHDPSHTIALLKLGMVAEKQGQHAKAIGYYERASQIGTQMTPQRIAILTQLADAYRKGKKYAEAVATYQRVLQHDPAAEDAILGLGLVDWEQGRQDAAIARWKEVLKINPDNTRAKNLLQQAGGH